MIAEDPWEMAGVLIRDHGLEHAHELVLAEITMANHKCDYYALSVWREVRAIIRDQIEILEEEKASDPIL